MFGWMQEKKPFTLANISAGNVEKALSIWLSWTKETMLFASDEHQMQSHLWDFKETLPRLLKRMQLPMAAYRHPDRPPRHSGHRRADFFSGKPCGRCGSLWPSSFCFAKKLIWCFFHSEKQEGRFTAASSSVAQMRVEVCENGLNDSRTSSDIFKVRWGVSGTKGQNFQSSRDVDNGELSYCKHNIS